MGESNPVRRVRIIGAALILFAIGFNIPYSWLAANFDYPDILRRPPGEVLQAFADGGGALVAGWACFALAALLFAPAAVAVARVTQRGGNLATAVAALGVGAAVTQAIGLSRWVYAVPGLAEAWMQDAATRPVTESIFMTLHQFAGVGVGEAIGQTLTAFWLIGVAATQYGHPRFGKWPALLGFAAGVVLILGLGEGLATVGGFDPGIFGMAAPIGFLMLTAWLIWTGILCLLRPGAEG